MCALYTQTWASCVSQEEAAACGEASLVGPESLSPTPTVLGSGLQEGHAYRLCPGRGTWARSSVGLKPDPLSAYPAMLPGTETTPKEGNLCITFSLYWAFSKLDQRYHIC